MNIYRFQVVKQLNGDSDRQVFEARDERDAPVIILEWTPQAKVLVSDQETLLKVRDGLRVEAFSYGKSLCIAAATDEDVRGALERLRSAGLFVGTWPGFDPPVLSVEKPPKRWGWPWRVILASALLMAVFVAIWMVRSAVERQSQKLAEDQRLAGLKKQEEAAAEKAGAERARKEEENRRAAKKAEDDRAAMKAAEDKAAAKRAEDERARKEEGDRRAAKKAEEDRAAKKAEEDRAAMKAAEDRAAAKRADEERAAARLAEQAREAARKADLEQRQATLDFAKNQEAVAANIPNQYHRIHLFNDCAAGPIMVAIHFQSLDRRWVTEGWWKLESNADVIARPAYSRNGFYYFYATGGGHAWSKDDPAAVDIDVVDNNTFTHIAGTSISGRNPRKVKAFEKNFQLLYGDNTMRFTCSK